MDIGTLEQQIAESRQRIQQEHAAEALRLQKERQHREAIEFEQQRLAQLEAEKREQDWQQAKVDYQHIVNANQEAIQRLTDYLTEKLGEMFTPELRTLVEAVEQTYDQAEAFRRPRIAGRQKFVSQQRIAKLPEDEDVRQHSISIQEDMDKVADDLPPVYPTWAALGDWVMEIDEKSDPVTGGRRAGVLLGVFGRHDDRMFGKPFFKRLLLNENSRKNLPRIKPLV